MSSTSVQLQLRARAELELRRRSESARRELALKLADSLIDWAKPLLKPYRYKCLYGGRGSAKSYSAADALLITGLTKRIRVLCAREFQNSIKDSVHTLLKERIEALGLIRYYTVQEKQILGTNGSNFIFKGVHHNVQSIKSMTGLTYCWIEEGESISKNSWRVLVPTIREPGSEIWVTFNPCYPSDIVYQELVANPRDNSYVEQVNWNRNPYFPETLNQERLAMLATDPDEYRHIWEGEFWGRSEAQIFSGKWIVDEFDPYDTTEDGQKRVKPGWNGPYHGADFGFAQDPTTLVRVWEFERRLYIERESYAKRLELDQTAQRWKEDIPDCERYVIRSDSARPESISYLRRHGMPRIESVKKWHGSVEDGIAFLRSYEKIVIHPRCKHTLEEARMYSYKTDPATGEIRDIVVDAWNHCWDGVRYACAPLILARGTSQKSGMKLY